jgi:hypothetical protein
VDPRPDAAVPGAGAPRADRADARFISHSAFCDALTIDASADIDLVPPRR